MKEKYSNITMSGDREKWIEFTHNIRKDKKRIWDVLEPLIQKYLEEKQTTPRNQ